MPPPQVCWLHLGQVEDSQASLASFKASLLACITLGINSKPGPAGVTQDCPNKAEPETLHPQTLTLPQVRTDMYVGLRKVALSLWSA